jgi:hypothetical protein
MLVTVLAGGTGAGDALCLEVGKVRRNHPRCAWNETRRSAVSHTGAPVQVVRWEVGWDAVSVRAAPSHDADRVNALAAMVEAACRFLGW